MIDCSKCRYFYGYDGVGELWTGCSIHGDFKGEKTHCNHFEKKVTKSDLLNKIQSLEKENEQLRQKIKHCVYVDVDNAKGCMNCKYDEGSICSILNCGTHDYLEGVSECGLKYWEGKDE